MCVKYQIGAIMESSVSESGRLEKANRCVLSRCVAETLDKDTEGHVRVESDESKAYLLVGEVHEDTQGIEVNRDGLRRIDADTGDTVTIERTVPIESREKAFLTGDIAETFWNRGDADVFISCPHGGDIEYNTDEMGMYLFKELFAQGVGATA